MAKSGDFAFDLVENIVQKGENAVHQHFLLFLQHFQKVSLSDSLKLWTAIQALACSFWSSFSCERYCFSHYIYMYLELKEVYHLIS